MKVVVLAVRIWNCIFAIGLRRKTPGEWACFAQSESGRIRLSDAMVRNVHRRLPRCQADGCGAPCSEDGVFDLCDLHQAAIRRSELIELQRINNQLMLPLDQLVRLLRRTGKLAKRRAAAAKWN